MGTVALVQPTAISSDWSFATMRVCTVMLPMLWAILHGTAMILYHIRPSTVVPILIGHAITSQIG